MYKLHTTQKGISLIKYFEGFRTEAYLCSAGFKTIGYGHRIKFNEVYDKVSHDDAQTILYRDIFAVEQAIGRNIFVALTHNQFDAIVSFTYNVGAAALQRSTLRQEINNLQFNAVKAELLKWVHISGRTSKGLIKRRLAEAELFYFNHVG